MRRNWKKLFLLVAAISFSGCSGNQSMLNPAAEQADRIGQLWWLFCIVMSVIYALVLLFTVIAVARRHKSISPPTLHPEQKREKRMTYTVSGLAVATIVILFIFMTRDFLTGRDMQALNDPNPLKILVTAHQWWWQVKYENDVASNIVQTANEIHLPLGKAVHFDLQSPDVIHSFWSPNFDGKKDIVPGHPTSFWFRPTKTGTFYGQCGEFCGLQHAHMRFVVVVEPPEQFQNWLTAISQPANPPQGDLEKHGAQVFLNGNCIMCHSISGTPARGTVGPDLTHLASRQTIGAGTIPNTRGHLGGWVLDAPRIKPGVLMPQNNLSPADFQALLAYLETLK
jgi:cytochrome c oxidase subunit 2